MNWSALASGSVAQTDPPRQHMSRFKSGHTGVDKVGQETHELAVAAAV